MSQNLRMQIKILGIEVHLNLFKYKWVTTQTPMNKSLDSHTTEPPNSVASVFGYVVLCSLSREKQIQIFQKIARSNIDDIYVTDELSWGWNDTFVEPQLVAK